MMLVGFAPRRTRANLSATSGGQNAYQCTKFVYVSSVLETPTKFEKVWRETELLELRAKVILVSSHYTLVCAVVRNRLFRNRKPGSLNATIYSRNDLIDEFEVWWGLFEPRYQR
eukprot:scaffold1398_cov116-Cylindrotheca_fusiformis.AAC.33